jgi:hypothetical protein
VTGILLGSYGQVGRHGDRLLKRVSQKSEQPGRLGQEKAENAKGISSFLHMEGNLFEKIPAASCPFSGIYFSFTNLFFILAFEEESFLAAGNDTGFLSWDQISLRFALRKLKQTKRNQWIVSKPDKNRVNISCDFLLIWLGKARKNQFIDISPFNPVSPE